MAVKKLKESSQPSIDQLSKELIKVWDEGRPLTNTNSYIDYFKSKYSWDVSPELLDKAWDVATSDGDTDEDYVTIDNRRMNTHDCAQWLRDKLEEYGNTYFFPDKDRSILDKMIKKFGSTYFWKNEGVKNKMAVKKLKEGYYDGTVSTQEIMHAIEQLEYLIEMMEDEGQDSVHASSNTYGLGQKFIAFPGGFIDLIDIDQYVGGGEEDEYYEESLKEARDFDWNQKLWCVVKDDGRFAGSPCLTPGEARELSYGHEGSKIYKMELDPKAEEY